MDAYGVSDLWQQSWPRQRNLAKQILALGFGPIQVDNVDGNEIMITLARRYKSSTLTTRLGDTVKWIWDFKRYPEGTTVADLHSLAAVASWLDKEQDVTSTMTLTTTPPHDIPPYIQTGNDDDDDDDGQQQLFFDHSGAV